MLCQPILLTAIKYTPQSQPLLRACPPEDDTGMIHRTCLYPVKKRIQNQREREAVKYLKNGKVSISPIYFRVNLSKLVFSDHRLSFC